MSEVQLSRLHPHFLVNHGLLRRSENLVAMISERSFNTLQTSKVTKFCIPFQFFCHLNLTKCRYQWIPFAGRTNLHLLFIIYTEGILFTVIFSPTSTLLFWLSNDFSVHFEGEDHNNSVVKLFLPPKPFFPLDRQILASWFLRV